MARRTTAPSSGEPHAYLLVADIRGFSQLSNSDHDKVVRRVYSDIATEIRPFRRALLDKKTVGDGFLLYFANHGSALGAAMALRDLFSGRKLAGKYELQQPLAIRIALHSGKLFWARDKIEERPALFGRNIITAARLEPIVRPNEVWATRTFVDDATTHTFPRDLTAHPFGEQKLAKSWGDLEVYGITRSDEEVPSRPIPSLRTHELRLDDAAHPHLCFGLVRLRNKTDGALHLRRILKSDSSVHLDGLYYVFGYHDVVVRFRRASGSDAESWFTELLGKERIIRTGNGDSQLHYVGAPKRDNVSLVTRGHDYLKAFLFVSSDRLTKADNATALIEVARSAAKSHDIPATYKAGTTIIFPLALRTSDFYALGAIVDAIEKFVTDKNWDAKNVTFPVHDFEEFFEVEAATA